MSAKFSSTKVIHLGSTAFRQPYATSHCKYLHGYRLQAKFWFSCDILDNNNWVVDFGGLNDLKTSLESKFDHTTCIAANDPQRPVFEMLHDRGIIDLRVCPDGVGIEKFAQYCWEAADQYVRKLTLDRCWCEKVEVWEHEGNSATYENVSKINFLQPPLNPNTINKTDAIKITVDASTVQPPVIQPTIVQPSVMQPPVIQPTAVAERKVPQYTDKTKNTFRDPFKGTSWGNPTK